MRRRAGPAGAGPPAQGPTAPGWYPDPDDPGSIRRWDGASWGAERRPRPGWAPPPPPQPPPPAAAPARRRWGLLAAGALAVAVAVAAAGAARRGGPDLPPRTVFDAAFTRRADAACGELLPPIRADRPDTGPGDGLSPGELAPRIERAAGGLDELVARLDGLAVPPGEQAAVDAWLADWRAYIEVGRRYAQVLRSGDTSTGAEVGGETGRLGRRIFAFARANAMPACVP